MPFSGGMPANLEMLLSASPPLFVHNNIGSYTDFRFGAPLERQRKFLTLGTAERLNAVNAAVVNVAPIRPCLALKEEDSPRDCKKRVWFADDKGLSLTHVKVMSEPSDCPPRFSDDFLEHITSGIKALTISEHNWEISFPQPASDYLEFRRRLDRDCVSLENVIVRDEVVSGTIKVSNLSFHKEVFVRFSFDRWVTHKDFQAEYVPNGLETSSPYDTFKFNAIVPSAAIKFGVVEFCIGYQCDGQEYWDNHSGVNYRMTSVHSKTDESFLEQSVHQRFADAVTADFDRWTEFASWNHLINDSPYW